MHKEKLAILILSVCLLIATALAVSGFYYKPVSTSPVSIVFQGNDYSYEHQSNIINTKYWNNFPYLVLMSEGKRIEATINVSRKAVKDSLKLSDLVISSPTVFLRIPSGDVNIPCLDTISKIIGSSNANVKILVDDALIRIVDSYHANEVINADVTYVLNKPLNIAMEQLNKPYFFTLDSSLHVQDVFVPRMEIMEVLIKYLVSHSNI